MRVWKLRMLRRPEVESPMQVSAHVRRSFRRKQAFGIARRTAAAGAIRAERPIPRPLKSTVSNCAGHDAPTGTGGGDSSASLSIQDLAGFVCAGERSFAGDKSTTPASRTAVHSPGRIPREGATPFTPDMRRGVGLRGASAEWWWSAECET